MAEGKKSFVLYCDIKHTVDHLTDDQAGKLFKHIIDYVNDKNPESSDIIITLAFEPIKQQLKRDLKKWVGYVEKQRDNGKKGGRPPLIKETQKTQAFLDKPKKAANVSVDVNVNDNVTDTVIEREKGGLVEVMQIRFTIEKCLDVSLLDHRWVKANKATEQELLLFNNYLEQQGKYEMLPIDYKKYFCTIKGKYPDLIKKKFSIEELREMAKQMDEQELKNKAQ